MHTRNRSLPKQISHSISCQRHLHSTIETKANHKKYNQKTTDILINDRSQRLCIQTSCPEESKNPLCEITSLQSFYTSNNFIDGILFLCNAKNVYYAMLKHWTINPRLLGNIELYFSINIDKQVYLTFVNGKLLILRCVSVL